MYNFYTSSKLNGVPVQADGTGRIEGMSEEHLAEGTPAALQQQVHAPLITDPGYRRLQGPKYLQAWDG